MKSPLFYICCICVFSTCLLSMEKEEVVKKVVEKMLKRNVIKIPYSCDTKTNFIALIISKLPNELTDDEEVLTLSVKKIAVINSAQHFLAYLKAQEPEIVSYINLNLPKNEELIK